MLSLKNLTDLIKLSKEVYADKVYACWIGKNIGGTMGTPYEGQRQIQDIQGFVTKPGEVLPNDDLDLQLVWLHILEELGPKGVNEKTLGEAWMSFVTPYWNEYGIGKTNMQRGILPPASGDYCNNWRNSNGAWIRTEIWASLAPASPDIAVQYAYYDACVDHGIGEGTYAAMFVAAMESAAYVISDIRKLIGIGLSRIPYDCRMARTIRLLLECYDGGMDWKEARECIMKENADIGDGWFEAPSNVAYAILGILYGEGDFKRSMILAIDCGDDTDCTGATVGSLLGIMGGTKAIPEDWKSYLGDDIVTVSIGRGTLHGVPLTCTELTEHVVRMAPMMLEENRVGNERFSTLLVDGESEIPEAALEHMLTDQKTRGLNKIPEFSMITDFGFARCIVSCEESMDIQPCGERKIKVRVENKTREYGSIPYHLSLDWIAPYEWHVEGAKNAFLPALNAHAPAFVELEYTVFADENVDAVNRLILEVIAEGRPTPGLVSVPLMGA